MNKNKIVTINGQHYDAHTGLPVAGSSSGTSALIPKTTSATTVHASPQKSQTLVRRVTKKPVSANGGKSAFRTKGRSMDIARSSKIARFAPHPTTAPAKVSTASADIKAVTHPAVAKAHAAHGAKHAPQTAAAAVSTKQVKHAAISAALSKPAVKHFKKDFFKRHPRLISITSISIIVAILGAYLTYTNLPSWSVSVAAAQAGIDATYPEYRPDGYRLNGPVTYSDGEVTINFTANTGSSGFSVKQSKSSWDSSAVLDNVVREQVGQEYITSQERGLTIYTYSGNAAWVNGGILYTVEGDAPLSGEQIRRIATSL